MIHYYCFIENGVLLTPETKVFKVAVGDNQRDQIKKTLVDCYATDAGAFFRVWDDATDFHLSQMAHFSPADPSSMAFGLNVIRTDIKTLYRNIIDGSVSSMENPPSVVRNAFRLLSSVSPSFFMRNHSLRKATNVPAVSRKNLSRRPTPEDHMAAIGFAIMALLYWLGSLVGCWERAIL